MVDTENDSSKGEMRLQSNCLIMKVISILEVLIKRLNYGLLNPKKKFVLFPH